MDCVFEWFLKLFFRSERIFDFGIKGRHEILYDIRKRRSKEKLIIIYIIFDENRTKTIIDNREETKLNLFCYPLKIYKLNHIIFLTKCINIYSTCFWINGWNCFIGLVFLVYYEDFYGYVDKEDIRGEWEKEKKRV